MDAHKQAQADWRGAVERSERSGNAVGVKTARKALEASGAAHFAAKLDTLDARIRASVQKAIKREEAATLAADTTDAE